MSGEEKNCDKCGKPMEWEKPLGADEDDEPRWICFSPGCPRSDIMGPVDHCRLLESTYGRILKNASVGEIIDEMERRGYAVHVTFSSREETK